MSRHLTLARLLGLIALFVLLAAVYLLFVRPAQLRWGATVEEVAGPMPGDGLVRNPTFHATRAVTIAARPEDIWPWLVQIGYERAGFYGYDLIENLGSKRGILSADRILPEFQHPRVGDRVYMSPVAYLVFHSIAPNRFLIWSWGGDPPDSAFTWALYPIDQNHTRLISRIRFRHHWTSRLIVLDLFTEFADHVAVPKILLGIRDRAEGRPAQPLAWQAAEIAVWVVALLEFAMAILLIFFWRRWWRAWIAALAAALVLLFALYARQPVWIAALLEAGLLTALFRLR